MISAGVRPPGTRERLDALARERGVGVEEVIASGLEAEEERAAEVGKGSSPRLDGREDKERPGESP